MWLTDMQKIGVGLTLLGALFMMLDVMLFFDDVLLALGNVLFPGGHFLTIGPQKTFYLFARKNYAGPPASSAASSSSFLNGQLSAFWWKCLGFSQGAFSPSFSLSSANYPS